METLKKEGVRLTAVCLTHAHFDHIMGLPYLMEVNDKLPVYLHEDEQDVLLDPQLNLSTMVGLTISLKANRIVKDGEEIELLGEKRDMYSCSGTYKGRCLLLFFSLWVADFRRYAVPEEHWKNRFPNRRSECASAGNTIKTFVLPPETRVFSGHTPPTTIGEEIRSNPFLL